MLKTFSLITLLALGTPALAIAQDKPVPPQRGRANRAADGVLTPNEVMNVLDGYALVQAQEALQLSEEQYGRFVTRLKNLQDVRRQNLQARHRIVQELRRLAGPQAPSTNESSVRQQLKALRDHEDQATAQIRKAYDALDEVLDTRQQARFRLFEERLELRKMDLLMRARQGAARRQER